MAELFDLALEKRFAEADEIALVNITAADTLLIKDSTTGDIMRLPFSTLSDAIKAAIGNSFATLVDGKVPASQLPSYVDDVLEYANFAGFPNPGESGKIYIAIDTNKTYRWGGSAYVDISSLSGSIVRTANGVVANVASSTDVLLTALPNLPIATYLVTVCLTAGGAPNWTSNYILNTQQTTSSFAALLAATGGVSISMSGLNLMCRQTSGIVYSITWSLTRIV